MVGLGPSVVKEPVPGAAPPPQPVQGKHITAAAAAQEQRRIREVDEIVIDLDEAVLQADEIDAQQAHNAQARTGPESQRAANAGHDEHPPE